MFPSQRKHPTPTANSRQNQKGGQPNRDGRWKYSPSGTCKKKIQVKKSRFRQCRTPPSSPKPHRQACDRLRFFPGKKERRYSTEYRKHSRFQGRDRTSGNSFSAILEQSLQKKYNHFSQQVQVFFQKKIQRRVRIYIGCHSSPRKKLFSVKTGVLALKPEIFQAFVSEKIKTAERRKARRIFIPGGFKLSKQHSRNSTVPQKQ